jgi:hypothetical protein
VLGIGLADLTTRRLLEKIDREATNANVLTSTFLERAKVPMVMPSDREAIEAAARANWGVPEEETRFVRIPNTLHLEDAYLSENLLEEARQSGELEVVAGPEELRFDPDGYLEGF